MSYDVDRTDELIEAAENSDIDSIYRAATTSDGYDDVLAVCDYFGIECDLDDPDFDPVDLLEEFV